MPERMEELSIFLDTAKEIEERYEIDTTIMEHDDHVTVSYTHHEGLKQILTLADEFSVQSQNGKVLLTLAYYTHATYYRGRKMTPLDAF